MCNPRIYKNNMKKPKKTNRIIPFLVLTILFFAAIIIAITFYNI